MFSRNTIGSNWSCNWSCNWSYCELCVSLHPWCSGLPEVMNSVFFLKKKVLPVPLTHRLMTTQHKINQTPGVFLIIVCGCGVLSLILTAAHHHQTDFSGHSTSNNSSLPLLHSSIHPSLNHSHTHRLRSIHLFSRLLRNQECTSVFTGWD